MTVMLEQHDTRGESMRIDRRRSRRWTTNRPLAWRRLADRVVHQARVTVRSLHGMAVEMGQIAGLSVGDQIKPADRATAVQHGFENAVVRRVERTPEGQTRVYLEILA